MGASSLALAKSIYYLRLSKKCFVLFKIWLAARILIAILSLATGRLATRKARSALFKKSFSNVKPVSEVNCSKSSNICSRSSQVTP